MRVSLTAEWMMRLGAAAAGLAAASFALAEPASAPPSSLVYDKHCAMCHQKSGAGLRGQFPRLAGRAARIGASAEGRRFLIEVNLFGMAGQLEVDGAALFGLMPPFASLSDEDLAAALNYVVALDDSGNLKTEAPPTLFSAAEIAAARSATPLSATQVHAKRAGVIPKEAK